MGKNRHVPIPVSSVSRSFLTTDIRNQRDMVRSHIRAGFTDTYPQAVTGKYVIDAYSDIYSAH